MEVNQEAKEFIENLTPKGLQSSTWKRNGPSQTLMRNAAVALAKWGAFVLPTHGVVKNKATGVYECSCDDYSRKQAQKYKREWKPCAKIGKVPFGNQWQENATNDHEIAYNIWSERKHHYSNIGILCGSRSGLVGLDIDGEVGLASLAKLEEKFGPLPRTVTVKTGSDGRHFWFRLPEGVEISNSAKALGADALGMEATNVDVRGTNGQLITAPSVHKSGNQYEFLEGCGIDDIAFDDVPLLPQWLVEECAKAKASNRNTSGTKAKKAGAKGSPDSQDGDAFADAGAAMGGDSASNGDGVEHFLALIGDHDGGGGFDSPIYRAAMSYFSRNGVDASSDELQDLLKERILAAECKDGRNVSRYATDEYLNGRIKQARQFIEANPPNRRDQDGDGGLTFYDKDEAIAAMNKVAAVIQIGGNTSYLVCQEKGEELNFKTKQAASDWFANWRYVYTDDKNKLHDLPVFDVWLKSSERRQFSKVVFRPDGVKNPKHYNTWTGLSAAPKQGDWALLKRHLFEVWCDCDPDLFEWTLAWFGQLFQQPEVKPGTAMVVYSPRKGTGKSIVARAFRRILDIHASTLSASDALTAKFNGFMERSLLVIGEEIIWGGKRDAIGPLKAAITESTVMLEKKYQDPVELDNFSRFLLFSNEERAIPAEGDDERRFFVLRAGDQHIQDTDYFGALASEIDNGGTEAMLFDLMGFDFNRVDLRNPPKTAGLAEQTEANLSAEMRWWYSILTDGGFFDEYGKPCSDTENWEAGEVTVSRQTVFDSFNAAVKTYGMNAAASATIGRFLSRVMPTLKTKQHKDGRRDYVFPPLAECRKAFEQVSGVRFAANQELEIDGAVDMQDIFYQAGHELVMDADIAMIMAGGLGMEAALSFRS